MSVPRIRRLFLRAALAALAVPGPRARAATEATRYASQAVTFGSGGFLLNFDVLWSCDDAPAPTTSAPGRIDLLDGTGALVASVVATIGSGLPIIRVHAAGALSGAS